LNALQGSRQMLHQKIDTVVYELQSLADQEREGSQKRSALSQQATELEHHANESQQQLDRLNSEVESLRQQRDQANGVLTEKKIAVAAEEQLMGSFDRQKQPLEQRISELTQLIERRRGEISSFVSRKAQAELENDESRRA